MNKKLKTPLRYPGGKSRAVAKMMPYFPPTNNIKEYREPFLGGGSVALWVTQYYPNLERIWVNDKYWLLYNFWIHLQKDGEALSAILKEWKTDNHTQDKARILFNKCKVEMHETGTSDLMKAAMFWTVNKCGFSGLTELASFSAGSSDKNFTLQGIDNLIEYSKLIQNWYITNLSYENLLVPGEDDENVFIYLDPPYEIKSKLYGKKGAMHKGFDHDLFAEECNKTFGPQIAVSYNADQSVMDRFPDWQQVTFPLTYTMRSNSANYRNNQKKRDELLLLNYD